jgi:hypothetical protein
MKQTAVEWLYERLERMIPRSALYDIDKREYFKQAKEMEKQQIIDAYTHERVLLKITAEQYYNETYKNQ